jgi:hypothetical protein
MILTCSTQYTFQTSILVPSSDLTRHPKGHFEGFSQQKICTNFVCNDLNCMFGPSHPLHEFYNNKWVVRFMKYVIRQHSPCTSYFIFLSSWITTVYMRSKVLAAMKMSTVVFWVVPLWRLAGKCSFQTEGVTLKTKNMKFSETSVNTYKTTWRQNPEGLRPEDWGNTFLRNVNHVHHTGSQPKRVAQTFQECKTAVMQKNVILASCQSHSDKYVKRPLD